MSSDVRLDWCSSSAAKYACERWHYSGVMPSGGVKIGVWERNKFVGAVIYGVGAGNVTRGERYGLSARNDVAELMRVSLGEHETPTSKIVSISMRMVAKQSPGLKMLISFADEMSQGHLGVIYQATNWYYLGTFQGFDGFVIHGKVVHSRSVGSSGMKQSLDWIRKHVDNSATRNPTKKHRYAYPLTKEVRGRLEKMKIPFPKRSKCSGDTSTDQVEEGGSIPT